MASAVNRRITLASRPKGIPGMENFHMKTETIPLEVTTGKVLVRVEMCSIDPAMRIWLTGIRTYFDPVNIGDVMPALAVGRVVLSGAEGFNKGDLVRGMLGWQDYVLCSAGDLQKLPSASPELYLGVLGINGLSAYVALVTIAKIQPGETVVVSTAAGAVGSVAVQIAKLKGCRVVGIAGSPSKCQWVQSSLGADVCINYKTVQDWNKALKTACPSGIDVYLDNVGGETLIGVINRMNVNGRIAMCGSIESYNQTPPKPIPNYSLFITKNLLVQGFIVMNYASHFHNALQDLREWMKTGKLQHKEHIIDGLERCPEALRMLFTGENQGKMIVRVSSPSPRL